MELVKIEVRNYRSIFERSSTDHGLILDLAGLKVLVGRNNCGKLNLFRALAAALDPAYEFDAGETFLGRFPTGTRRSTSPSRATRTSATRPSCSAWPTRPSTAGWIPGGCGWSAECTSAGCGPQPANVCTWM
jgi:hypothetical protein